MVGGAVLEAASQLHGAVPAGRLLRLPRLWHVLGVRVARSEYEHRRRGSEEQRRGGHSVSAMIGVLAAIREPGRFSKLVLVGPSPRYINDAGYRGGFSKADIDELLESLDSNYLGWSAAIAPVIMGNPERPELAEELAGSFCRTDPAIARVFARTTFLSDNRADLAQVTVPTLILQCARDAIAPAEVGAFVHDQIPGSTLVTLAATGHCPQLSAPDATLAAIASFASGPP
jgi:sigma-B regulation protein RsbQ